MRHISFLYKKKFKITIAGTWEKQTDKIDRQTCILAETQAGRNARKSTLQITEVKMHKCQETTLQR
jgi:hypothetical protein